MRSSFFIVFLTLLNLCCSAMTQGGETVPIEHEPHLLSSGTLSAENPLDTQFRFNTFVDADIVTRTRALAVLIASGENNLQIDQDAATLLALIDYRQQLISSDLEFNDTTGDQLLVFAKWSGQLEEILVDTLPTLSSGEKSEWLLHTNKTSLQLLLPPPAEAQKLSGAVQLEGLLVDGHLIVTRYIPQSDNDETSLGTASLLPASAPACTSMGDQKALVVAVNYQDDATTTPPISQIDDRHFGANDSLAAYWQETSYNQVSLTGNTLGWHTLDANVTSANACIMQTEIRRQALEYAALSTDITQYNRLIVIMRDPNPACSWAGRSTSSCVVHTLDDGSQTAPMTTHWALSSYQAGSSAAVYLAAHEGGHSMGLGHANVRDWGSAAIGPVYDDSGSTFVEYGDRYDAMGNAWQPTHYNALHKLKLNWLNSNDVEEVNGNAITSIEALSVQPPFSSAKKVIKLYRGRSAFGLKEYLWLETRNQQGFDTHINNAGAGSIHIHQQRNDALDPTTMLDMQPNSASGVSDYFDAPIPPSGSYTDPYSNITISHMGTDSNGNIQVEISTPASDLDVDEDGLSAQLESIAGSNPNNEDSDADGMLDSAEVCFDGDCTNYNPYPAGGDTNPLSSDTDGDTMDDQWERINGLNPVDPSDKFLDPDNDGTSNVDEYLAGTNPQGNDFDSDGLLDGEEIVFGTDPMNPDSDSDGQTDGWEVNNQLNPLDPADATLDPDLDGLDNITEFNLGTNIYSQDSDGDTLTDPDEVNLHGTDPANNDTDNDSLFDDEELYHQTDPLSISADSDADGMHDDWESIRGTNIAIDDAAKDNDNDGSNNIVEFLRSTLPNNSQSRPDLKTITPDFSDLAPNETGTMANPYIDRLNELVASAEPGDTLLLPSGYYFENASFSVSNHIRLHGPTDRSVVIQAPVIGTSLNNWSEIRNITIRPTVTVALVAKNTYLLNNDIYTAGGIVLQSANQSVISNNTVYAGAGANGIRVLSSIDVRIANNTIANFGNGVNTISGSVTVLENNILSNTVDIAGTAPDSIQYNVISDGQYSGLDGNLSQAPTFINAGDFDFHLANNSIGIAMGNPDSDFEQEPTPNGSRINIGAYGNTSEATTISDADNDYLPDSWELAFGLSTAISNTYLDSDSDNFSNYHEFHAGSLPNNAASTPALGGLDSDSDGFDDAIDNCPFFHNMLQADSNGNGIGNACESEFNVPAVNRTAVIIIALLLLGIQLSARRYFTLIRPGT